jgi:hypothetical protein
MPIRRHHQEIQAWGLQCEKRGRRHAISRDTRTKLWVKRPNGDTGFIYTDFPTSP